MVLKLKKKIKQLYPVHSLMKAYMLFKNVFSFLFEKAHI